MDQIWPLATWERLTVHAPRYLGYPNKPFAGRASTPVDLQRDEGIVKPSPRRRSQESPCAALQFAARPALPMRATARSRHVEHGACVKKSGAGFWLSECWSLHCLHGNQTTMRSRTKRFQSPMTILRRLGLGLGLASGAAAAAGRGRLVYLKTRKDEMSTKSRSLKVMAPSRPAPPFEGILKLKTAPALIMSVVERMRSDSAKNIVPSSAATRSPVRLGHKFE